MKRMLLMVAVWIVWSAWFLSIVVAGCVLVDITKAWLKSKGVI